MTKQNLLLIHCDWSTEGEFKPEKPGLDINSINTKCIGRVDPVLVLESFNNYDGVLLIGCLNGDCHFIEGNVQTKLKVKMLHKLMSMAGIETSRLALKLVSPSDMNSAMKAFNGFLESFVSLGKLKLKSLETLDAARLTAENYEMRSFVSHELTLTKKGNVYGDKLTQGEFDEVADAALTSEYYRNWIHMLLKTESLSVKRLAERVGLDTQVVLAHIVVLNSRGWIQQDGVEGMSPLYVAMEVQ
jgi:F420-non-reducing hydrogenase iron-sulfur subunit